MLRRKLAHQLALTCFSLSLNLVHAIEFTSRTLPPISFTSDSASNYSFSLNQPVQVTLDKTDASKTDAEDPDGLTLIPPSLKTFVHGFNADLVEIIQSSSTIYQAFDASSSGVVSSAPTIDFHLVESTPQWESRDKPNPLRIHFSLLGAESDLLKNPDLHYATSPSHSSEASHEAYVLNITSEGIKVEGVGARGAWWASRIILQEIALSVTEQPTSSRISIRSGSSFNSPAYATRGLMLDAGRHFYRPGFLKDLCSYLSFFSVNEFHYHLSDHYPLSRGPINTTADPEGWKRVYSHFSLKSNKTKDAENAPALSRLAKKNESLDYEEFMDFQNHCAEKGITVIPEIEAP